MNVNTFLNKLNDAEGLSCIENAYSHIVYDIFNIVLDDTYSLVDISSWRRKNEKEILSKTEFLPENIIAIPDFVIVKKNEKDGNLKISLCGCVEVKFHDYDVKKSLRLEDVESNKGFLNAYNYVIYTNGWKWVCYKKNADKAKDYIIWECDFRTKQNNEEYGKLLGNLCMMNWENK